MSGRISRSNAVRSISLAMSLVPLSDLLLARRDRGASLRSRLTTMSDIDAGPSSYDLNRRERARRALELFALESAGDSRRSRYGAGAALPRHSDGSVARASAFGASAALLGVCECHCAPCGDSRS